jgi:hypothetical protein
MTNIFIFRSKKKLAMILNFSNASLLSRVLEVRLPHLNSEYLQLPHRNQIWNGKSIT